MGNKLSQLSDVFDAVLNTPMIPGGDRLPGVPSTTLGETLRYGNEAAGLPGTLARKAVEKMSPPGFAESPLFPYPGMSPIPFLDDAIHPTVAGGAEFAANVLAPSALEGGSAVMEELGARSAVPKAAPEALPRPFDFETTLEPTPSEAFDKAMPQTPEMEFNDVIKPDVPTEATPEVTTPSQAFDNIDKPETYFHGSGTPNLTKESLNPTMTKIDNLFGQGVYLTDNQQIAEGYAKARGRRGTPSVYSAGLDNPNLLDLEKPAPQSVIDLFTNKAKSLGNSLDPNGDVTEAVKVAGSKENATGESIFRAFSTAIDETSHADEIPVGEYHDVFLELSDELKQLGYDGYTHTGGLRTGKPPHKVVVIINPKKISSFGAVKANPEAGNVINPVEAAQTIGKSVSKAFDTTGKYDPVASLKADRFGDINANNFDDERAIKEITEKLTPEEGQALMLRESNTIPRLWEGTEQGSKVQALLENPTPELQKANELLDRWNSKAHQELQSTFPEMGKRDKYFPSSWDMEKAPDTVKGRFGIDNPYTQTRTIPTRAQGLDLGLVPTHDTPADALRAYYLFKNASVANNQFIGTLSQMKDAEDKPFLVPKTIMTPEGKLIDNPDISAKYTNGGKISPLLNKYVLHPEVAKDLQFMGGIKRFPLETQTAILQAAMKKSALSLSFFHHMTLTEAAVGLGVNPLKAISMIPKALRAGGAAHLMPELSRDALQHGLTLGGVTDVEKGLLNKVAETIDTGLNYSLSKLSDEAKETDVARAILNPAIKFEDLWDKTLWSAYHPIIKLLAYETNVQSALRKFPHMDPKMVKRQVAEVINNAAGGQPWELLFNNPEWQHLLQNALLATDWTASNIRIAENAFEGGPKGSLARKYWMRQLLLFLGATEGLNYLNTLAQNGKGQFTWNNDPDHKFDVWLYKDGKGRNYYMQLNKALVEPFRWLSNPLKTLAHKLSPLVQTVVEQLTGHTTTGYDLNFEKPGNRAKAIGNKFVPFSVGGSNFAGTWPISSGMSYTKFKQEMETAIWKNDIKRQNELYQVGLNNGLPAARLQKEIQRKVDSTQRYEADQKLTPSPTSILTKRLTGFTMGELAGKQLQSIRDKLKNVTKTWKN